MLLFFDKVNEMELKEPWPEVLVDLITNDRRGYEEFLVVIDEALISVNSKCSADLNELPDNYIRELLMEIQTKLNAFERKITSNRVQEGELP